MLDRKSGRLVAEQLGDQRQIEPLPRIHGAIDQFCDQALPQRAKIVTSDLHPGQRGDTEAVHAGRRHLTPHLSQAPERQIAPRCHR